MRWIARRKAAWVLTTWLTALGLARAADPAPAGVELLPPVQLQVVSPTAPASLIPLYARPASPYGPAMPGLHPAVSATPILIGEAAPTPREVGQATLPPARVVGPNGVVIHGDPLPWENTPTIQPFPRMGVFVLPPSGPGYYSFLDLLHHQMRDQPPALAYPAFALQPPSGFDADYRYIESPDHDRFDIFDQLKRMHPTPETMLTIGGQSDMRYMNEINSRLGKPNDEYMLYRNRVWADLWYTENFRIYGEFISAIIDGNDLPPLPIDKNEAAFLNLFVEARVCDLGGAPVYVRVGRQELLFGSQRLISPLDWANTRRTFEGVRAYRRSDELDVDVFAVHPVVINPTTEDKADTKALFYGIWTTYRPTKDTVVDLYYLGLKDDSLVADRFVPTVRGDQDIHTFGARWAGNEGSFLFDFEGMCQKGTNAQRDVSACAFTAALGWEFAEHPWRPQVWASYDYASGTKDPSSGADHTFNQLFPFGHYYLGFIDLVGRQNIEDLNFQVSAYPDKWVTLLAQFHHFQLAEAQDFLYNAAGVPTRRSPLGIASRDVGNEIDLLANFHITPHQDFLIGYSKLFAGQFIRDTGPNVSPELFYAMYNFRW
jgi:hypothetical protein